MPRLLRLLWPLSLATLCCLACQQEPSRSAPSSSAEPARSPPSSSSSSSAPRPSQGERSSVFPVGPSPSKPAADKPAADKPAADKPAAEGALPEQQLAAMIQKEYRQRGVQVESVSCRKTREEPLAVECALLQRGGERVPLEVSFLPDGGLEYAPTRHALIVTQQVVSLAQSHIASANAVGDVRLVCPGGGAKVFRLVGESFECTAHVNGRSRQVPITVQNAEGKVEIKVPAF